MRLEQANKDVTDLVVLIFVLMIVLFVLAVVAESYKSENQELKSFLSEKYNFSEEECVEWQCIGGKSLEQARKEGLGGCGTECISYCHTRQVQDGEECRITEVKELVEIKNARIIVINEQGYAETYPITIDIENATRNMWEKYHVPIDDIRTKSSYETMLTNQTICTPKFKNETYGCQSGDDVRRVRELIK